jgi:hypothetical protein
VLFQKWGRGSKEKKKKQRKKMAVEETWEKGRKERSGLTAFWTVHYGEGKK